MCVNLYLSKFYEQAARGLLTCIFLFHLFVGVAVGLTNPPTDLVCKPYTGGTPPSDYLPYIDLSWRAPVPNGGYERGYRLLIYEPDMYIGSREADSTNITYTDALIDDIYTLVIIIADASSYVVCEVDTTDRCK